MTRPSRLTALCFAGLALAGCAPSADDPAPPDLGHVHALAFDDAGELFVASHHGVYAIDAAERTAELVGGVEFDAMGMAGAGEDLLASGHPGDLPDDVFVPPDIGLVRHTPERGWESVALAGQTDFHGLATSDAAPDVVAGLPTDRDALAVSEDGGTTWTDRATVEARDLAVDHVDPAIVVVTTEDGPLVSRDAGRTFAPVEDAPLLVVVAADPTREGGVVGVAADSTIWRGSAVTPGTFERLGASQGPAVAVAVHPVRGGLAVAVADDRGVVVSDDDGNTWDLVLPAS